MYTSIRDRWSLNQVCSCWRSTEGKNWHYQCCEESPSSSNSEAPTPQKENFWPVHLISTNIWMRNMAISLVSLLISACHSLVTVTSSIFKLIFEADKVITFPVLVNIPVRRLLCWRVIVFGGYPDLNIWFLVVFRMLFHVVGRHSVSSREFGSSAIFYRYGYYRSGLFQATTWIS